MLPTASKTTRQTTTGRSGSAQTTSAFGSRVFCCVRVGVVAGTGMPAALPHALSGPHRRQQWPVQRARPIRNGLLIALGVFVALHRQPALQQKEEDKATAVESTSGHDNNHDRDIHTAAMWGILFQQGALFSSLTALQNGTTFQLLVDVRSFQINTDDQLTAEIGFSSKDIEQGWTGGGFASVSTTQEARQA